MSHPCGSCTSLCQDGRNQRGARGCEKPGERGGVGAVLAFGDYATHPLVAALITWKPGHRTLSAGREYPPLSQKRGPPVELALVVLVVATFAALVVPSLVGSRIVRPHQVLLLARSATDLGCRTGCSCRTSEKIALRRFSIRHRPMVVSDGLHHCQLLVRKRLSHSAMLDPARINPLSLLHFPFGASSSLRCCEGHGHTSICNAPCSATDTRELISAAGTAEG
jgi:hypothetical protein